jgi:hypothetical protein
MAASSSSSEKGPCSTTWKYSEASRPAAISAAVGESVGTATTVRTFLTSKLAA